MAKLNQDLIFDFDYGKIWSGNQQHEIHTQDEE
jgi:hypothetical protein